MNLALQNQIINGDCLEKMKDIPDNSIDMILTDLPYAMTRSRWDFQIDLDVFWLEIERIVKNKSAIVLTSAQPFTSKVVTSNMKLFRYEMIWEKSRGSNIVHSKFQPLKVHENILVFSQLPSAFNKKHWMNYFPQFSVGKPYDKGTVFFDPQYLQGEIKPRNGKNYDGKRYPRSVVYFSSDSDGKYRGLHPTQKPVALFEYLVKTYTNENELVLDCCAGSGTTAIACLNTKRNYICIEKDNKYFEIMKNRITKHQNLLTEETRGNQ